MSLFGTLKSARLQPPVQRVLALDAGSRCHKLLLAESRLGHLRILKEEAIDLQAEGLVSVEETKAHLQATLEAWGQPALALVLPQHLSISQVIDLPLTPESQVRKLIQDESVKLSGVSESRITYDFVRLGSTAPDRQQFWVSLCQEGEIRERILRLGVEHDDLCEVTTTANALLNAYRAQRPLSSRAILVHLGAQSTVVVILLSGQGAFAASFQMGGDFFTRSLARILACPEETAESLKRERNLLVGEDASPQFAEVADGWVAELKRQLNDWFADRPALAAEAGSFELVASGGAFALPGLVDYLKSEASLAFQPWPRVRQSDTATPSTGFEVAFGTALQALGCSAQPVSLLPEDFRANWQKRLAQQRIEFGSVILALLCALALALGIWRQFTLNRGKHALLVKVQAAQVLVNTNNLLTIQTLDQYENLRPFCASQQNTLNTLNTLALLQQSRSNRGAWCVLLADQQSYFSPPPAILAGNPAHTNLLHSSSAPLKPQPTDFAAAPAAVTNASPAKPGMVAELCMSQEPEAARQSLSQVVGDLKQQPLFAKVDLLSEDLRRNLADPKVIIPDRYFVLTLDYAATDFEHLLPLRRPTAPGARPTPPRLPRFGRSSFDDEARTTKLP